MFTNDTLFQKLGLKIPQTFPQLLTLCRQAQADGTVAVLLAGANTSATAGLVVDLAVDTVYGPDPHFTAEQKAGSATFDGSAGWHTALQEFIDMSNAGCFEPGAAGTSSVTAEFAQGQALIDEGPSSAKGSIDALEPQFSYSFHPLPATSASALQYAAIHLGTSLSVNSRSSAANQAAARTFIDFVARPAQNELYAKVVGGLTQNQFLKQQLPSFMPSFGTILRDARYVVLPYQTWWNAGVWNVLMQDAIGLLTGQTTIDGVLQAMDAAWKEGPS
jgi:raffinose/stachyose/melibiose transport system substrate-binding protein